MCRRVQGSQIFKKNWIILIHSRVIVILLIWVSSALGGVGQVGEGFLGWSTIVYMSSGMFRGKESSNRIKLSRLVQELLNFGVSGSLQFLGVGGWVVNMIHSCKWPPPWEIPGNSLWCHMRMCMHVHVCVHMHMCGGYPLTTPTYIHPPPIPQRGPPESVKIQ